MTPRKRDVFCFLQGKKIFKDYKILNLKSGLSNKNYIIESDSKKYVVRLNKKKADNSVRILEYEHHLLKFLESKNINFVPRSLFYDREKNIHVLTYIEGRKVRLKNISSSGLVQVAKKLHEVNILAKEFLSYCKKNNLPYLETKSEIENIKKKVKDNICNTKQNKFFNETKDWILARLKSDFRNYQPDKNLFYLNHGDPADNIIINKKQVFIIDWEYVKFNYGPGLIHILAHGRLDETREKTLLREYSKISGINFEELCFKTYKEKMAYYLLKLSKILKDEEDEFKTREGGKEIKENIEALKKCFLRSKDKAKFYAKGTPVSLEIRQAAEYR